MRGIRRAIELLAAETHNEGALRANHGSAAVQKVTNYSPAAGACAEQCKQAAQLTCGR